MEFNFGFDVFVFTRRSDDSDHVAIVLGAIEADNDNKVAKMVVKSQGKVAKQLAMTELLEVEIQTAEDVDDSINGISVNVSPAMIMLVTESVSQTVIEIKTETGTVIETKRMAKMEPMAMLAVQESHVFDHAIDQMQTRAAVASR